MPEPAPEPAPNPEPPAEPDPPADHDDDQDDDADVKTILRSLRREAATLRQQLGQVTRERDKALEKSQTEHERALAAARQEGAAEAAAGYESDLLNADVLRLAGGKVRDPDAALRLLDLEPLRTLERGQSRDRAIAKALDELVEEKDYLAANGDAPPVTHTVSQGPRTRTSRDDSDDSSWLRDAVRRSR